MGSVQLSGIGPATKHTFRAKLPKPHSLMSSATKLSKRTGGVMLLKSGGRLYRVGGLLRTEGPEQRHPSKRLTCHQRRRSVWSSSSTSSHAERSNIRWGMDTGEAKSCRLAGSGRERPSFYCYLSGSQTSTVGGDCCSFRFALCLKCDAATPIGHAARKLQASLHPLGNAEAHGHYGPSAPLPPFGIVAPEFIAAQEFKDRSLRP